MCLFPQKARREIFKSKTTRIQIDPEGDLVLPCGKCTECKSLRAVEWATRAKWEIATNDENCFLTLTYDDDNIVSDDMAKHEFKKFIKRYQKKHKLDFKYMASHEFGKKNGRVHHHALLFGHNPEKQKFIRNSPNGNPLFHSDIIHNSWQKGFHSIAEANEKVGYYIASYGLKSNVKETHDHYGEIQELKDTLTSSNYIGLDFFVSNIEQIIYSGQKIPRYFIKYMKDCEQDLFDHHMGEWSWQPEWIDWCHTVQKYYQVYQDILIEKRRTRTPHEFYAKYVLDQVRHDSESEFRSAPEKKKQDNFYKKHLKFNRDNSQRIKKDEI